MVEIPRPFDGTQVFRRNQSPSCPPFGYAQDKLQRASSVVAEGQRQKTWIPAFAGMTEREIAVQSTLSRSLGFEPRDF